MRMQTPVPVARGDAGERLRREIDAIAPLDASVLFTGETGTGKGRAARELHERSPRSHLPFVHVDCAALSKGLIESELFGHERGAFTGAGQQHVGRFERAGCGTIFLDEIGDMAWELQAKLLRVLEDREFERVGGASTLRMQARVIAATSRDLFPAERNNAFRTDLYFRLSVFHLEIPPLRARLDELPELIDAGLSRLCTAGGRRVPEVRLDFIERFGEHDWPGNVRELINTLERALAHSRRGILTFHDADRALRASPRMNRVTHKLLARDSATGLRYELADLECREISDALARSGGNIASAARALGIPRGTLRHKIRKYGLEDDETSGTG